MKEILKTAFLVVALVVVLATAAFSQTSGFTYVFPNVTAPGLQLVISNVSAVNASVQVTFYSEAGITAQSLQFAMAAGTQTIIDDSRVSLGSFAGAATVQSATPLVVNVTTNTGST